MGTVSGARWQSISAPPERLHWGPAVACEGRAHRPQAGASLLSPWYDAEAACLPSGLADPGLHSHLSLEAPTPGQAEREGRL